MQNEQRLASYYNAIMASLRRLIVLMFVGSFLGFMVLGEIFLSKFHGYDHGMGLAESQRCCFAGAVTGAFAGVFMEFALRALNTRSRRYSLCDLIVFLTPVAFALGTSMIVIRFARSTYPPW